MLLYKQHLYTDKLILRNQNNLIAFIYEPLVEVIPFAPPDTHTSFTLQQVRLFKVLQCSKQTLKQTIDKRLPGKLLHYALVGAIIYNLKKFLLWNQ